MIKAAATLLLFITLGIPQISLADSIKDAEIIFDEFISPIQLAVVDQINADYSKQPEQKKGLDFLNKIDFRSIFMNSKTSIISLIQKNFSPEEISYVSKYVSQPEVKKFNILATEHKNFETAFSLLSEKEKEVVNNRNATHEASIAPKFNTLNSQIKSLIAYRSIDAIEKHKDELEKLGSTDETCERAYKAAIYNSSFLICGLGQKLGYPASSKTFAKIIWRGDFLEKDIPKALSIYKKLLGQDVDPETAFYYGVLNFNMTTDQKAKRLAACWIKLSASKSYNDAVEFYNDIKGDYPNLPDQCQFISSSP